MRSRIPERDWKVFRDLREKALDRFCRRALDEIASLCTGTDDGMTNHERYLTVYDRLHAINDDMAYAFDNPARSIAWQQIAIIRRLGLWTDEELARFSEETLQRVRLLGLDGEG
ncbi:hypothetical protein [Arhodomonas sp. SL1]|uniref:hypothetical protein n=1 Tax=Arhodomonas sp. SL1 TaxID=3425691 RepID=UPI003F881747